MNPNEITRLSSNHDASQGTGRAVESGSVSRLVSGSASSQRAPLRGLAGIPARARGKSNGAGVNSIPLEVLSSISAAMPHEDWCNWRLVSPETAATALVSVRKISVSNAEDLMPAIALYGANGGIDEVYARGCDLTDSHFKQLAATGIRLAQFDIGENRISATAAKDLSLVNVQRLIADGCSLGEHADHIANNNSIEIIDLSSNGIDGSFADALSKRGSASKIHTLILSENQLDSKYVPHLMTCQLAHLCIENTGISSTDMSTLATHPTLESLAVGYNDLGAASLSTLVDNTKLRELDLSGNRIGVEGAGFLSRNKNITSLVIDGGIIEDAGVEVLLEGALPLVRLSAEDCEITDVGAAKIATKASLITADLRFNAIGDEGAIALADSAIRSIDLRDNPNITGVGKTALDAARTRDSSRTILY